MQKTNAWRVLAALLLVVLSAACQGKATPTAQAPRLEMVVFYSPI